MAIMHQPQLFSWNDVEAHSDLHRLHMVLEALPDEPLMQALEAERKGRRDDYPLRAVWNSILAGLVFGHTNIEWVRRELRRNGELRQGCGFDVFQGADAVPPPWVYTRFLKKLLRRLDLVEAMFETLVRDLTRELSDLGTRLAVDSNALRSFGFERRTIRGLKKMRFRVSLALAVMLALALSAVRAGRQERMRSLVNPRAA